MKYLIYSKEGDGIGLAYLLIKEGEDVSIFYQDKSYAEAGKGIMPQAKTLDEGLRNTDLVVFDMVKNGQKADDLRRSGYMVIGASEAMDRLELDRDYALEMLQGYGVGVPKMHSFSNVKRAMDFLSENGDRWVIKPDGNLPNSTTIVNKSPEEISAILEQWKEKKILKGNFLLQEFVEGVEVSHETWYSNGKPIFPANATFETKRFMNDNLGTNTGCMSSVVFELNSPLRYSKRYDERFSRIYSEGLKKIEPYLEYLNYTGPLDINGIVTPEGKYQALELTPRFGYSAIYAMLKLLNMPLGEFLYKVAEGTLPRIPMKEGFGVSLRLSAPPYPFETTDEKLKHEAYRESENNEVSGIDWDNSDYLPLDVKKDGDKCLTAGIDGIVMEVASYGKTIEKACNKMYQLADQVKYEGKQYRTDVQVDAEKRFNDLVNAGYF